MSASLSDSDVAAVRETWDVMQAANFATDWNTYFQHVTQDVVAVDPRLEGPLRGSAALREWVDAADLSSPKGAFAVEEISGSGDVACLVFTFEMRWMEGGTQTEARGKGMSVFRRESDGAWRLSHSAWNTNP